MFKCRTVSSLPGIATLLFGAAFATAAPRDEGEAAFREGDFTQAAALFEQAIGMGDTSNATRYNLAVSYFRLNDMPRANSHFRALFEQGFRSADVLYSLAVTEKRLGESKKAAELFSAVAASNTALSDEALAQLADLGLSAPVGNNFAAAGQLRTSLQLNTGYNDAIVEVQDGKLTRKGDKYAETLATLVWERPFANRFGLDLNVSLYNNSYADTREQNFSQASAGVQQSRPFGGRTVFWTLDVDASLLEDRGFLHGFNAGAGLEERDANSLWRLFYRYRRSLASSTAFAPYAGKHHRLQADYNYRPLPRHQLGARVYYEHIERKPVSTAQASLDLSRDIARLDLNWSYQLLPSLQANLGLNYGEMQADDYQRFANGTRLARDEENLGYSLGLRKAFGRDFALQASYSRNDNDSSLSDFTYEQAIFELGFAWVPQFP